MGASLVYLNEPNTEIEHEVGENDYLKFAAGSMQGWRLNMVSMSCRELFGPAIDKNTWLWQVNAST